MKKLELITAALLVLTLSSCQAIGDIFKAGMGVGIFIVVAIVAVVIFILAKIGGGGK